MKLYFLLFIAIFVLKLSNFAQKRERFPSYFGFQFKPIIPGDFLSKSKITVRNENFSGLFSQKYGYSFGAIARVGLTKLISIETGINQVKRNYDVNFSLPDSNLYGKTDVGILSYDIPLNVMIYIQLSEKLFMNTSLGTSFVYYPSNVGRIISVENKINFSAEGRRLRRFDAELNANFGFELRTEKSGFIYIGASAKVPFAPIYKVAAVYKFPSEDQVSAIGYINGSYLSIDLRYFFPYSKSDNSPNKTPIIQ